ncbi:hypothetical protein LJC74_01025 [Eubacteriales bacterium OttesenSCG-928-A19]|nr:hypothetical protein [Eubacteriales bacterium OttesenSCG-928-A19]
MDIDERLRSVLLPLPCPVTQEPGGGSHDTYVTFNVVDGEPTGYASNRPSRTSILLQVHIFTKALDGTEYRLIQQSNKLLQEAGFRVRRWRFVETEKDTGKRHWAATCEWIEKIAPDRTTGA